MSKPNKEFIIDQYRSGIDSYADFTKDVGLWQSEHYVFEKYLHLENRILDLGCGTGRTTFPLFQLGYTNIIGVDLTPEMIYKARELNDHFNTMIDFNVGDALALEFEDAQFDVVIFSFNGIMSIPGKVNRDKAVKEINRVLKTSGTFIFTTHDRTGDPAFLQFWKEEKERWDKGEQHPELYEFGDRVTTSRNESREIFIHIPDQATVKDLLSTNRFEVVETFYRSDKFDESEAVKVKSGECRFWIGKKL